MLPKDVKVVIDESSWEWQPVFKWLQQQGNITRHEMYRTFNCGVGMVIALPETEAEKALNVLRTAGENAWLIGRVEPLNAGEEQVIIR